MKTLKINIDPVIQKIVDNNGKVTEKCTHYIGFIYGMPQYTKNFYLTNTRTEMLTEMFTTINELKIKLI